MNRFEIRSKALAVSLVACGFTGIPPAGAQVTPAQLSSVLPTESELCQIVRLSPIEKPLKFGRIRPAGERLTTSGDPVGDTKVSDLVSVDGLLTKEAGVCLPLLTLSIA